jgi:hypothetical protein
MGECFFEFNAIFLTVQYYLQNSLKICDAL